MQQLKPINSAPRYSVVIPVYNSAAVVEKTIDAVIAFFERRDWRYELILVNDGSSDDSWHRVRSKAHEKRNIIAINLLRNYGQHNALFCGIKVSIGDYVITIDDDLQNPPEEMAKLIEKADEGYDLVFGRFERKQHSSYRRIGSKLFRWIDRHIFYQPPDLTTSNFRLIRRDVVDRMCAYRTGYPYITGLALMFSSHRANVWVEHHSRSVGKSGYNLFKIASLLARILFNYSSYPLHVITTIGFIISALSFIFGAYLVLRRLLIGSAVPGWTSVAVMLAFFNGVNIVVMSMLGEYLSRLVKQTQSEQSYYVKEIIRSDEANESLYVTG